MEPDYDWCYKVLGLEPGATWQVINAQFHKVVFEVHPDTVPEAERPAADRRMQDINVARDRLREFWDEHNCAPPSPAREQARREQAAAEEELRRRQESQRRQEQDRARREQESAQRAEQERIRNQASEDLRKKGLPIEYPVFEPGLMHKLYEYFSESPKNKPGGGDTQPLILLGIFFAIVLVLGFIPSRIADFVNSLAPGSGQQWSEAARAVFLLLFIPEVVVVGGNVLAHYRLYKQNSGLKPFSLARPPDAIWQAAEAALSEYKFRGRGFVTAPITDDPSDATRLLTADLDFEYKPFPQAELTLLYSILFRMKVKESVSPGTSVVCYWFECKRRSWWLYPVLTVQTGIRKALTSRGISPR